ncbi:hypothetical protein [Dactylosporangium sp. CS-033363]|uniref:hypothetical protein n=1 Tax=Dactylosporangium sp. CS-033363 TaxID=3239935 RepID=UPI003D94648C
MRGTKWWFVVVVGAATVLVFAWLGRLAGVTPELLWTVGAAFAALTWTVVLVSAPWNLYFAARRVVFDTAVSRGRGIPVKEGYEDEASLIARRMLWFAIGGHVATSAVAAVAGLVTGNVAGYWVAGFFLLTTLLRPAGAYFAHHRQRIAAMSREVTHPREDVVTLRRDVAELQELGTSMQRQVDALQTTIDATARRLEAAVDGISDHQDLVKGLRALTRMLRAEQG